VRAELSYPDVSRAEPPRDSDDPLAKCKPWVYDASMRAGTAVGIRSLATKSPKVTSVPVPVVEMSVLLRALVEARMGRCKALFVPRLRARHDAGRGPRRRSAPSS
jgi:hypothetical protein